MSVEAPVLEATPVASPPVMKASGTERATVLGIAWLHGSVHVASFRRQQLVASCCLMQSVRTFDEFAAALEDGLNATGYRGTEVFLVLENEEFAHQVEATPKFSEKAARAYLAGKVERFEKEHDSVLWVSQKASAVRNESAYMLHMLPRGFYYRLNEILIARRLELTRIVPLIVPLQLELDALAQDPGTPLLIAAEAGDATAVIAGKPGGELLFSRTTLASFRRDPARVAVEINRSLLYAKQQYGAVVDRAFLLGSTAQAARAEVESKCGVGKHIVVRETSAEEWLRLVAKLPARHPVNLLAGYLHRKMRNRLIRTALIGACWLGFGLAAVNFWAGRVSWESERASLDALGRSEESLHAEREALVLRNAAATRDRALITTIVDDALPPVPGRFIAYLSGLIPAEMRLTEASVRHDDDGGWSIKIEGMLEADEETLQMTLGALRRQLARGPFKVHVAESARASGVVMIGNASAQQRFSLEGRLFEK